jgi:hypothetical protein
MPAEQEQAEAPEVDLADLQDQQDLEEPAQEIEAEQQEEQQQEQAQAPQAEPEPEEITVMIGDEPVEEESQPAPDWVRELRKKNREDQKRIRELEARLAQQQAPQATAAPGKKPELEDFDYDTAKYEASLADWFDKKRRYEDQVSMAQRQEQEVQEAWQNKLQNYAQARTSLKVKDFEDAESTVAEMLNVTQQGVVIQGAENPALVIYALGKNPKKAKELASIDDPVKFAFAIAKLETQLKVTGKKMPPPPEKTVGGTAPIRGAVDSTLERLRADAERSGDYSKVYAYKKQKKA